MSISNQRDYEQLKINLPLQIIIRKLLPEGKRQGKEWVALNPTRPDNKLGSFKVDMNTGKWSDFATGDAGGDIISLYAYVCRCNMTKAYDDLASIYKNFTPLPPKKKEIETELIYPVPHDAPPLPEDNRVKQWEYRNEKNELLFYVARYTWIDGRKNICPYTYRMDDKGNKSWHKKSIGSLPKPLYNIPRLVADQSKNVLIVEGEKTADAAQNLLPDWTCITWHGGANAVHQVDFSLLAGRKIVCWPDNDDEGIKAMKAVKKIIMELGADVKIIDLKWIGDKPKKWDLADAEKEGATTADIMELIDKLEENNGFELIPAKDFPDLSEKERPLNTTDNIAYLLNHYNITIKYNLMANLPEFSDRHKSFSSENEADCFFTEISNLCVKNGVPKIDLYHHINLISERNRYHPAIEFIESNPWDGVSRINDLLETICSPKQELANKLIYRWLISCVAALYLPKGIPSEGALVLQGKQKIGKTYWLLKLFPTSHRNLVKEGVSMSVTNKDDIIKATNVWIAELGEIESTFKKSDVNELKNFITSSYDEYRAPFGRFSKKFWRRTVFYGSVNSQHFLADETGNRRFWTVPVTYINYEHTINMQQLWAEIKIHYDKGEGYRLTLSEQELLNESNQDHECINPLKELLFNNYHWDSLNRRWMTATQIIQEMEMIPDKTKTNNLANILRESNIESRKSNRGTQYSIPYEKSENSIYQ